MASDVFFILFVPAFGLFSCLQGSEPRKGPGGKILSVQDGQIKSI